MDLSVLENQYKRSEGGHEDHLLDHDRTDQNYFQAGRPYGMAKQSIYIEQTSLLEQNVNSNWELKWNWDKAFQPLKLSEVLTEKKQSSPQGQEKFWRSQLQTLEMSCWTQTLSQSTSPRQGHFVTIINLDIMRYLQTNV